jgi:hypothetical protein
LAVLNHLGFELLLQRPHPALKLPSSIFGVPCAPFCLPYPGFGVLSSTFRAIGALMRGPELRVQHLDLLMRAPELIV